MDSTRPGVMCAIEKGFCREQSCERKVRPNVSILTVGGETVSLVT